MSLYFSNRIAKTLAAFVRPTVVLRCQLALWGGRLPASCVLRTPEVKQSAHHVPLARLQSNRRPRCVCVCVAVCVCVCVVSMEKHEKRSRNVSCLDLPLPLPVHPKIDSRLSKGLPCSRVLRFSGACWGMGCLRIANSPKWRPFGLDEHDEQRHP